MAIPKLQYRDEVHVTFKNQHKMQIRHGNIYASATKINHESMIFYENMPFIIGGGRAIIIDSNKTAIWFNNPENDREIRVERKFISSVKVIKRFNIFHLGGTDWDIGIPDNPKKGISLYVDNRSFADDEFSPAQIRKFLAKFKAVYLTKDKKKTKKKSKKKKVPKSFEVGEKITKSKLKEGMILNLQSIDWDDSPNALNPLELSFVYKGKLNKVEFKYWSNLGPEIVVPDLIQYSSRPELIRADLIKSMTLAKKWEPPPPPERVIEKRNYITIGAYAIGFYEKRVKIGCQEFDLDNIKKLYKELVKVYGEQ